jgi:hypothetical protein
VVSITDPTACGTSALDKFIDRLAAPEVVQRQDRAPTLKWERLLKQREGFAIPFWVLSGFRG